MPVKGFYTKGRKKRPITTRLKLTGRPKAENKGRRRILDRKLLSKMRTLENPLLYHNFLKKLQKFNEHFDEQLIDRTMEPEEALNFLKKLVKDLVTGEKTFDSLQEYRSWLSDQGIDDVELQNLILTDEKPPTEEEIGKLVYALHGRPLHAILVDRALKAKRPTNFRQYANYPEKYDLRNVDAKGKKTSMAERAGQ